MAEIDSLEIVIQSTIDDVNKSLDALIGKLSTVSKGITAIKTGKGLEQVAQQAKVVSENMGKLGANISASMKPVEEQAKRVTKTLEQITEHYKDLGKGFQIKGSTEQIQKQIDNLSNKLEVATLKKQDLELSGKTNTQQYEYAVRDVIKFTNQIESLRSQLDSIKTPELNFDNIKVNALEEVERVVDNIQERVAEFSGSGFNTDAMQAVFGDAAKGLENYEQAVQEFGKNVGKALNDGIANIKIFAQESEQSLKDFANQLSEYDKIIEAGGQETDAGMQFPIRGIEMTLEQLREQYPQAIELIKSYEALIERARGLTIDIPTKDYGNIDLSGFDQITSRAKEAEEEFNAVLNSLKDIAPKVDETDLKKLNNMLKSTEAQTERLRYELERGLRFGDIDYGDKNFNRLTIKIKESENYADALREKIEEVGRVSGFEKIKQSLSGIATVAKRIGNAFSGLLSVFSKVGRGIKSVFSKIASLGKGLRNVVKINNSSNLSFGKGLKTILAYGLGIRSLYMLFNKLRNAIKEGFENLIQYDSRTNQSISTLKSSLNQLKNSLAAAFAPIFNAIAPALNYLVQMLIKATNAINQLFTALTGGTKWIAAKNIYEDVAAGVSKATKAAKGALQPFDALNNLTTQDSDNGGVSAGDMFETLPVEDKFKDLAKWLKEMWKDANFYDLGKLLGEKLKNALDSIPWDKIKEVAGKLGKSIASLINGFIEVEGLAYSIGTTLAQALNTIFEFFNAFVHELHWESVGKFVAEAINGITQNIDWDLIYDTFVTAAKGLADMLNSFNEWLDWDSIASTVSNFFNTFIDTIYTFITETDWVGIATNLGKTLSDAFTGIDWAKAGQTVGEAFKALFDFIANVIENIDWWAIGIAVKDFLVGIDWAGVAEAFFEAVGAALGGLAAFIGGLIGEAVINAQEYFQEKIEEAGGNVVEGILVGILDALVGIGEWIYEHIFTPFINGFKKAFGIASPSKVMAEMGGFIVSGLLNGLKEKWSDITSWFSEKLQWLKDKIKSMVKTMGDAKSSLSGALGGAVGGLIGGNSNRSLSADITDRLVFDIPKYIGGGFPEDGLFFANHNELVGQFSNGKTAVANNDQIISGIRQAAYEGFKMAIAEMGGFNTDVNVTLEGDAEGLFRMTKNQYRNEAKRTGSALAPGW